MSNLIKARFSESITEIEKIIKDLRSENEGVVKELLKCCPAIPERYVKDNIYITKSKKHISMRISIFNSENLVDNFRQIIQALVIPFRIKIDCGYTCITPQKDIYVYSPSRYSYLNVDCTIMKDFDTIVKLFNTFGWEYSPGPNYKRDDSKFVDLIKDHHDSLFGFYTESKFIIGTIFYLELYIDCDKKLLDLWYN